MIVRIHSLVLLLVAAAVVAAPVADRSWIECIDGRPCEQTMVGMCGLSECHQPAQPQCVVRIEPGVQRVMPKEPSQAPKMVLVALATAAEIVESHRSIPPYPIEDEHPPGELWPKEGHAPRGPPVL